MRQGLRGLGLLAAQRIDHLLERARGLQQVLRQGRRQNAAPALSKVQHVLEPVGQPTDPADADDVAAALEGVRHALRLGQPVGGAAAFGQGADGVAEHAKLVGRLVEKGLDQRRVGVSRHTQRHVRHLGLREARGARGLVFLRHGRRSAQELAQLGQQGLGQRFRRLAEVVQHTAGGLGVARLIEGRPQRQPPTHQPAQRVRQAGGIAEDRELGRGRQLLEGQCLALEPDHARDRGQPAERAGQAVCARAGLGRVAVHPGHQRRVDVVRRLAEFGPQDVEEIVQSHRAADPAANRARNRRRRGTAAGRACAVAAVRPAPAA